MQKREHTNHYLSKNNGRKLFFSVTIDDPMHGYFQSFGDAIYLLLLSSTQWY